MKATCTFSMHLLGIRGVHNSLFSTGGTLVLFTVSGRSREPRLGSISTVKVKKSERILTQLLAVALNDDPDAPNWLSQAAQRSTAHMGQALVF